MTVLCRLLGVSKQAYFKREESSVMKKAARESFAIEYIRNVREKDPGIGGMKLWHMYRRYFNGNAPLGRDSFENIVHRHGLKVRQKTRRPRTTDSTHGLPVYPDLVKDLIPTCANSIWVADITYIPIWLDKCTYVFCYASLVMDSYTKEIIGWSIGPTLEASYPIEALKMSLSRLEGGSLPSTGLIHHSDRGVQYASAEYVNILKRHGIRVSMTESGDPKDNAQAERINNTLKNELLKGMRFTDIRQVKDAVRKAVAFYNSERPHMSLDMMTPSEASGHSGEIRKLWNSYREKAIKEKQVPCEIPEKSIPLASVKGSASGQALQSTL